MAFALHRAAPAILASAATVVIGMLCLLLRRPQLHRGPRSGPRHRRRRHLPGDGHAAPGAAGDLSAAGSSGPSARLRLAPSRRPTASGPASVARISPARARVWVVDRRAPADRLPRPLQARHLRAVDRGHLHEGVRLHQGPEAAGRARPVRHLQHRAGGRQHRRRPPPSARRWRASTASASPPSQSWPTDARAFEATIDADISSTAAFDIVEDVARRRARGRRAPTRWWVAARRSTSTPRSPANATTG